MYYHFGSCIYDCSKDIVMNRFPDFLTSTVSEACVITIFKNWAKYELNKSEGNHLDNVLIHDLDARVFERCSCKKCGKFIELVANSDETAIYNRILLYAEIFDNQIWNLKTERPVHEEMFSSHFEPFFYIWHLLPGVRSLGVKISDENLTLAHVAFFSGKCVFTVQKTQLKGWLVNFFRTLQC